MVCGGDSIQESAISPSLRPLLLLQAWGLTPLGLERINFVLTPLEAGLQADPCLFTEGREGGRGVKIGKQKSDHRASIDSTQMAN